MEKLGCDEIVIEYLVNFIGDFEIIIIMFIFISCFFKIRCLGFVIFIELVIGFMLFLGRGFNFR